MKFCNAAVGQDSFPHVRPGSCGTLSLLIVAQVPLPQGAADPPDLKTANDKGKMTQMAVFTTYLLSINSLEVHLQKKSCCFCPLSCRQFLEA